MHTGDSISPSITYDWLTLDDDDGDLTNGTPHSVEILAGFALHNMDDFPEPPEPLDNDDCVTARALIDGTHAFTTIGGNNSSDSYNNDQCSGTYLGDMHADVWFSYAACESGSMTVSTCDLIDFDSDIVVYEGTCGNNTQIACNGDASGCGGYSSITTFNVTTGNNYLIRVGGWSGSSEGSGQLLVEGPGACVPPSECPADTNNDGVVDVTDILAVVGAWGENGGPADVNGDGIVDVTDLLTVVNAWGACPE